MKEILRELARFDSEAPDLAQWTLDVVDNRIVDIHDWAKNHYYHPGMGGRTSIKVVMDALWKSDSMMRDQFKQWTGLDVDASEDPYHALPTLEINGKPCDVREGTGAINAYEAMMYGVEKNDAATRAAWSDLLLRYCHLDTLSMVLIFEHWRRAVAQP